MIDREQLKEHTRAALENNLEMFIRVIHPNRVLGSIHSELCSYLTREEAKSHQLVLLPRDHCKSTIAAYLAAWLITRNPAIRILYISSMSNLAVKQLKFIKDILTSDRYRYYWPDMVKVDEGKREKWTESEISVDHPKRKEEVVRDPTVFTAGLTTSIVGLHCDLAIMDDVVTAQNAWTQDGRDKTLSQYSLLASIEGADARELIVGTRYHPLDMYGTLMDKKVNVYDEVGELKEEKELYEVFLREVESQGDGSGEYLWPRQQRLSDGKWFGFNRTILEVKRSQYQGNTAQFRAQYYNNPNDIENSPIKAECFQYYDKSFLSHHNGQYFYKNNKLNVFAAIDFAYSTSKAADYSSIVVVGVDAWNNYYILDIDRFKSDRMSDYFQHLLKLHQKWEFRKVKAEVSVAQQVIVTDLKQNYIRPMGLNLAIEDFRPSRAQGNKEERINAILQPRYNNRQVWHYQGGMCQTLEEELVQGNPAHDDIKDALATCVDFCISPSLNRRTADPIQYNNIRFGGIS